ncbi:DUF819 family protein [Mycoplasmatota bacterium]|nr:DUF819 family protein [Mycoplasmatota bacterium]
MITLILQLLAIILLPLVILKFKDFIITKYVGPVGTSYLLGLLLALSIYLLNKLGLNITLNKDMGEIISHIAITLAIPLLLVSANIKSATKLSRQVLKSFAALIISAMIVATLVNYLYAQYQANGSIISAMAIGMYTGGTPNFNAIGKIFFLDNSTIALANLSDIVIGGAFYFFLLVLAKPLFSLLLKKMKSHDYQVETIEIDQVETYELDNFKFNKEIIKVILISILGVLITAILGLLLWIITGMEDGRMNDFLVPVMLIGVTVYGIFISFKSKLHKIKHTNVIGQYMILIFSFSLASSIDFTSIGTVIGPIFIILASITLGTTLLHMLINFFLKTDIDCAIVTLTAGIYGPAFIPAITKQLKNEDLTAPGLIIGSIGYGLGTFLGYFLGLIFLA